MYNSEVEEHDAKQTESTLQDSRGKMAANPAETQEGGEQPNCKSVPMLKAENVPGSNAFARGRERVKQPVHHVNEPDSKPECGGDVPIRIEMKTTNK
jgi:hypothetical protein